MTTKSNENIPRARKILLEEIEGKINRDDRARKPRRCLRELRRLARELGWTVQEVDLAIWNLDLR